MNFFHIPAFRSRSNFAPHLPPHRAKPLKSRIFFGQLSMQQEIRGPTEACLVFRQRGLADTGDVTLLMTDYYRLVARAVAGLENADATRRAALYGCARTALVSGLSGLAPPLEESEIERERLSLEAAIREIEAAMVGGSGAPAAAIDATNPSRRQELPSADPAHVPIVARDPSPSAARPRAKRDESDAREPEELVEHRAGHALAPLSARVLEALKIYRETVVEAGVMSEAEFSPLEIRADARDVSDRAGVDAADEPDDAPIVPRHPPFPATAEVERRTHVRSPSSPMAQLAPEIITPPPPYRSRLRPFLAFLGVLVATALAGLLYWQWDRVSAILLAARAIPAQQDAARLDVVGGIGALQRSPVGGSPAGASDRDPVPQRAVLYEEDPADPAGKRHVGSVIWRAEPSSSGQPLGVRARLEIPERRMSMTMSLRPNSEKALPASHTIEIAFKLPSDFPFGGVSNVLGILMKQTEEARGAPLTISTVKITTGMFLIGLSASDMQRNRELLEARSWLDIPIVYENGRRAILAIEKGAPGEAAFKQALVAWN